MKVLISDYPEILAKDGVIQAADLSRRFPRWDIQTYPYQGDKEELKRLLADTDALITGFLPLDQELLSCMKPGSCISVTARGYDNVNVNAASMHSIAVMAIEEYCTEEVAEHTMALLLGVSRCLKQPDKQEERQFRTLQGMRIGVFGYGRIGKRMAQLCDAFGMKVYVYAMSGKDNEPNRFYTDADTIYRNCDVITNHMSAHADNYHFFNEQAFAKMTKAPIFLNCGRGETVDTSALLDALKAGKISGAGVDVLEDEWVNKEVQAELSAMKNVIVTPHVAFASDDAVKKLHQISVDNAVYYLNQEYERITSFVPGTFRC